MKKYIMAGLFCSCALAYSAEAAPRRFECSYSPLQQVIRTVRDENDVVKLINNRVNLNIKPKCGGNVLQLAILRGNPNVVKVLLENGSLPLDEMVSLADFPIQGAPKEIPISFFAAYYAPRADIMKLFISAGSNILVHDSKGENILWYLNQNPVLSNTELSDQITQQLLMQNTIDKQQESEVGTPAKNTPKGSAKEETSSGVAPQQKEAIVAPSNGKKQQVQQVIDPSKKRPQIIDAEPDKPFKPTKDDAGSVLDQTDF